MVYSLKDKVVLITGASAGLGAALAHAFAAEGCHLILNSSPSTSAASLQRVSSTLSKLRTSFPSLKVEFIKADCAEEADNVRLVAEAISLSKEWGFGGRIDGCIANAGWTRFSNIADLDDVTCEDFDKCMAVNVKSPYVLLRELKREREDKAGMGECGGFMLLTSSVAGEHPGGSSLAYCVSKAANLHLMRCMAKHQGPKIRINAVKPGVLPTEWGLQFGEERFKAIVDTTVLKTVSTLENCALIYVMLAKNDSITGESITIDGGQWI
ncbi:putative short-chain dehydrogenase [Myxozyma melibiosi]|uniref:Short-chain dehydrogenase n=1 Tax=Myxozyma melibiosi TaxID=54550 RepID=A0ABR1F066_9ASCO